MSVKGDYSARLSDTCDKCLLPPCASEILVDPRMATALGDGGTTPCICSDGTMYIPKCGDRMIHVVTPQVR